MRLFHWYIFLRIQSKHFFTPPIFPVQTNNFIQSHKSPRKRISLARIHHALIYNSHCGTTAAVQYRTFPLNIDRTVSLSVFTCLILLFSCSVFFFFLSLIAMRCISISLFLNVYISYIINSIIMVITVIWTGRMKLRT